MLMHGGRAPLSRAEGGVTEAHVHENREGLAKFGVANAVTIWTWVIIAD